MNELINISLLLFYMRRLLSVIGVIYVSEAFKGSQSV